MFKLIKRITTVATVVLVAIGPSAAYARLDLNPPTTTPAVSSQAAHGAAAPTAGKASASSSQSFQWGDAAIGAAVMLTLVGVGTGAIFALRRRAHHPLIS